MAELVLWFCFLSSLCLSLYLAVRLSQEKYDAACERMWNQSKHERIDELERDLERAEKCIDDMDKAIGAWCEHEKA